MENTTSYAGGRTIPGGIFWFVVIAITSANLILLEQKYNIFTGGFLLPTRIASFHDRAIFITLLLSLECTLAYCFWCIFSLIGMKRGIPARQAEYLFMFFYGGGSGAITIAKYQVLAYFGDFMSLAVLRNLGGGSLRDGLMYGLEEGLYVALFAALAILACWILYRTLTKRLYRSQHRVIRSGQEYALGRNTNFFDFDDWYFLGHRNSCAKT